MSKEVGPGDPLWSLPTLTILSFCENSGSIISSDCILKQKPPAESHSRQGQENWKPQCCTTNLTSYEVVIDSLCGQQSTHTGQETGNAGVNVQQGGEDMLYYPIQSPSHLAHNLAVKFVLLLPCPFRFMPQDADPRAPRLWGADLQRRKDGTPKPQLKTLQAAMEKV